MPHSLCFSGLCLRLACAVFYVRRCLSWFLRSVFDNDNDSDIPTSNTLNYYILGKIVTGAREQDTTENSNRHQPVFCRDVNRCWRLANEFANFTYKFHINILKFLIHFIFTHKPPVTCKVFKYQTLNWLHIAPLYTFFFTIGESVGPTLSPRGKDSLPYRIP